jgi:hypothetical protein
MDTPFLTALDERARIKGSRDPIGAQAIWTRLGRRVVGNLTTVSSSVRDFTVLLAGHALITRARQDRSEANELAVFLSWEQIAAYARATSGAEQGVRGIDRVRQRQAKGGRIELGLSPEAQILSNQKTYGLWGLYTMPARASSLLEGEPAALSEALQGPVHSLLNTLGVTPTRDTHGLLARLLDHRRGLDLTRDQQLLATVAQVLQRPAPPLRAAYVDCLQNGGPSEPSRTQGCQPLLANLLRETLTSEWVPTPPALEDLARRAARRPSSGPVLGQRLRDIAHCERLLAPSVALFEHVLVCDGQSVSVVAQRVRDHWQRALFGLIVPTEIESLRSELAEAGNASETADHWVRLAHALASGKFENAIRVVVSLNALTMRARGASGPWVTVQDNKLDVRLAAESSARLPSAEDLPTHWRHPYFIPSLRAVVQQLGGAA